MLSRAVVAGRRGSGWLRLCALSGALLLAPLLVGCGTEYPQSTIAPQTDFAEIIQSLYVNVFWWTMFILALVWIVLAYIVVRFREQPDTPKPKQIHGHLGLEIGWTIGPALIVVAIAIPTIQAVFATQRPPAPEADALQVEVIGHRFWWEFRYPELGVVTANELHVPVGRPVTLRMHSADVIHSFWVPRLGGKRDVNPIVAVPDEELTHYNWLYFTVREPGVYLGQCAEFCGEAHSLMGVRVVAEEPGDFEAWVEAWREPSATAAPPVPGTDEALIPAEAAEAGPAEATVEAPDTTVEVPQSPDAELVARGREVFFNETYCALCHAIQGTPAAGILGPNLTGIGGRMTIAAGLLENNPENLALWIRNPQTVKPGAQMPGAQVPGPRDQSDEPWQPTNLTEEQIRAVVAYLTSLE